MTIRRILPLAAALTFCVGYAQAQTTTTQQPRETMPQQQDSHSEGTAPQGMGSTGWTGGTGGSHIGTSNAANGTESGTQQPADSTQSSTIGQGGFSPTPGPLGVETATGLGLQGPPTRFPTNKTPE